MCGHCGSSGRNLFAGLLCIHALSWMKARLLGVCNPELQHNIGLWCHCDVLLVPVRTFGLSVLTLQLLSGHRTQESQKMAFESNIIDNERICRRESNCCVFCCGSAAGVLCSFRTEVFSFSGISPSSFLQVSHLLVPWRCLALNRMRICRLHPPGLLEWCLGLSLKWLEIELKNPQKRSWGRLQFRSINKWRDPGSVRVASQWSSYATISESRSIRRTQSVNTMWAPWKISAQFALFLLYWLHLLAWSLIWI